MTEENMKKAKEVYGILCAMMDANNWNYQKDEENLAIFTGFSGDDLSMQFKVSIDAKRQLVYLISGLPFKMCEEKRVEGAVATCEINYELADGSFDYNVLDGTIGFRMTSSYRESLIGTELMQYMIDCACYTVDKYNDKLEALNDGKMTLGELLTWIKEN